ncbi:MAG: hypothetical protein E6I95_09755 [Chloroflexi bacterium]|nr:MAG: hypothetical protein E6I95_09755 [Chloroflexota bacterium]
MIDPANPDQLFALLRRHRIDPKHSLGQNFVVDAAIRDRVADAAGITSGDEVLEVGAGAGALTVALAEGSRRLVAVELDRRLIPVLRDVVGGMGNVEVVESDILKVDQAALFPAGGHIVAGNIPWSRRDGPPPAARASPPWRCRCSRRHAWPSRSQPPLSCRRREWIPHASSWTFASVLR